MRSVLLFPDYMPFSVEMNRFFLLSRDKKKSNKTTHRFFDWVFIMWLILWNSARFVQCWCHPWISTCRFRSSENMLYATQLVSFRETDLIPCTTASIMWAFFFSLSDGLSRTRSLATKLSYTTSSPLVCIPVPFLHRSNVIFDSLIYFFSVALCNCYAYNGCSLDVKRGWSTYNANFVFAWVDSIPVHSMVRVNKFSVSIWIVI